MVDRRLMNIYYYIVHMNSAGLNFGPQTCHDLGSVCHELDILRARSPQPWHLAV